MRRVTSRPVPPTSSGRARTACATRCSGAAGRGGRQRGERAGQAGQGEGVLRGAAAVDGDGADRLAGEPLERGRARRLHRVRAGRGSRRSASRGRTQVASIAACLPEQFMCSRVGAAAGRAAARARPASYSGSCGGQPRASSSSPAPAASPDDGEVLLPRRSARRGAARAARSAGGSQPAVEQPDGLQRLVGRAGSTGPVDVAERERVGAVGAHREQRAGVDALDEPRRGRPRRAGRRQGRSRPRRAAAPPPRWPSSVVDVGLAVAVAAGDLGAAGVHDPLHLAALGRQPCSSSDSVRMRVRELVVERRRDVGQVDVGDERLDVAAVAGRRATARSCVCRPRPRAGARGSSARIAARPGHEVAAAPRRRGG